MINIDGDLKVRDSNWNTLGNLNISNGEDITISSDMKRNFLNSILNDSYSMELIIDALLAHPKYKDKVFKATLKEIISEETT